MVILGSAKLLAQEELDAILSDIGLREFKEEVKIKNEARGRKPVDIHNPYYLALRSIHKYSNLSPWVDDVFTGAARLSTGNSKVSPQMVFNLLKSLPFISTREIKEHLNSSRTRFLWNEQINDDSYCRWLRGILLSAIKSLDYHTDKGKQLYIENEVSERDFFDLKADSEGWEQQKEVCSFYSVPVTTNLACPVFYTSTREIN